MILGLLKESDERIKKLIENENIEEKSIRFIKHPESKKFCYTEKRKIWCWAVCPDKTIKIPLDKNDYIIPYDNNRRLYNLAHEFGHIELNIFRKQRMCNLCIKDCLSVELDATLRGIKMLNNINAILEKKFWIHILKNKLAQCDECCQVRNQGKCPRVEVQKIQKLLIAFFQNMQKVEN